MEGIAPEDVPREDGEARVPLTVQQLLDEPALGLELVAGARGLGRPGTVRWAHVSEIPDPTPWLEGGEVLLTTGMGVKDDPRLQRRLVAGLVDAGCLALGFGIDVLLDAVPTALVEEADARDLPLFTVPYEVPFIAVARHVAHHTAGAHLETLRTAVDLHRRVLAAVVADRGLSGALSVVSAALPELAWLVYDPYGQELASKDPTDTLAGLDRAELWAALPRDSDWFSLPHRQRVVSGGAARVGERVEGTLAVIGRHHPLEHEALLIEQGLIGVTLALARGRSARDVRRQQIADLLDDVVSARVSDGALRHRLGRLGMDPDAGYQVLCLRGARAEVLGDLADDMLDAVVGPHDDGVICVVQPPESDHTERLSAALKARGESGLVIGRSAVKTEPAGLAAAFREASAAARGPADGVVTVRDVADLGLPGLLAGLGDDAGAATFVERVLGPVLAHDRAEGTALADTLRAYLRHGCRPGPAAAELAVHRHTLAYRLDRVRDLTGRDPRAGPNLLEFGLALELEAAR